MSSKSQLNSEKQKREVYMPTLGKETEMSSNPLLKLVSWGCEPKSSNNSILQIPALMSLGTISVPCNSFLRQTA